MTSLLLLVSALSHDAIAGDRLLGRVSGSVIGLGGTLHARDGDLQYLHAFEYGVKRHDVIATLNLEWMNDATGDEAYGAAGVGGTFRWQFLPSILAVRPYIGFVGRLHADQVTDLAVEAGPGAGVAFAWGPLLLRGGLDTCGVAFSTQAGDEPGLPIVLLSSLRLDLVL